MWDPLDSSSHILTQEKGNNCGNLFWVNDDKTIKKNFVILGNYDSSAQLRSCHI